MLVAGPPAAAARRRPRDRPVVPGGPRHDPQADAVVRAVVELSHTTGLTVVAEGVETAEQLATLAGIGCDAWQGFLIARPMPAGSVPGHLGRAADLPAPAYAGAGGGPLSRSGGGRAAPGRPATPAGRRAPRRRPAPAPAAPGRR
ncbi:EAL domain-containing protein [Geodermatophilus sp. SYSU D00779]